MSPPTKTRNKKVQNNFFAFGIIMIFLQIGFSLVYGFTINVKHTQMNTSSILTTIELAILVVGGFGLVFSYLKKLLWSGLGFTFFITAMAIQMYPLVNAFWTKVRIVAWPVVEDFTSKDYDYFLANADIGSANLYGNSMTNAMRAALAVAIAFSSILGRAGALECLFVSLFGIVGYELNRQVLINLGIDGFGTYSIFTYGGFMGLALGVILKFKEDREEGSGTQKHAFNNSSLFTASYALFGSLIIFALFPTLSREYDISNQFNVFSLANMPTSLIVGMGASVLGAICLSSLINGFVIVRDVVHSPIAGGIVVGSASTFITNPVYVLVAGFTAGVVQTIIQNVIERKWMSTKSVVSTISWSLFGFSGLVGAAFAAGYQKIILTHSNGFTYRSGTVDSNPGYQMLIAVISAGIGLGFGLISAIFVNCFSSQKSNEQFTDRTYWISDDGLTYQKTLRNAKTQLASDNKQKQTPIPGEVKKVHKLDEPSIQEEEPEQAEFSIIEFEMDFSQQDDVVPNYHAYL